MTRYKTFLATGVAPDGRLYPGDLNGMQDMKADLDNLTQNVRVGSLAVGEAGLVLSRYGAAEGRITGAFRTDGILRGLGGLIPGAFTTVARDALAVAARPYGLEILNTTTNQREWNAGTDVAPNWLPVGGGVLSGTYGARPAASSANSGRTYYATDKDVFYLSTGAAWLRTGSVAGDLFWTFNDVAATGRVLLQGQTVSRTGLYDELFTRWGTTYNTGGEAGTDFRLPDARGRALVMRGTNAVVANLGNNDGVALANRRGTKHKHTPHTHLVSSVAQFTGGANVASGGAWTINPSDISSGASDGGSGVATDPLDGGAYLVANLEAKL